MVVSTKERARKHHALPYNSVCVMSETQPVMLQAMKSEDHSDEAKHEKQLE